MNKKMLLEKINDTIELASVKARKLREKSVSKPDALTYDEFKELKKNEFVVSRFSMLFNLIINDLINVDAFDTEGELFASTGCVVPKYLDTFNTQVEDENSSLANLSFQLRTVLVNLLTKYEDEVDERENELEMYTLEKNINGVTKDLENVTELLIKLNV